MASSSSSTPSSSTPGCKYDVFISFRGPDTRNNVTDHRLKLAGIPTFRDDERLEQGTKIVSGLLRAIDESKIAVVVLSKQYTLSSWCLIELAKIVECMDKKKLTVLPVFHHVDPSDVRYQKGSFAEAFAKHENRFKDKINDVKTWRAALTEVANLSGWHLKDESIESKFIKNFIQRMTNELDHEVPFVSKHLVGMESRVQKRLHLCLGESFSPRGKLRRIIGSWQKGELLGRGSFGTVYEGYNEHGFFFAVKEVSLLDQGSRGKQNISDLEQEISLLKQFKHENIVQYLGTEKDESRIYIFLELAKGSLASVYKKYRLMDSQVSIYTRQILNGLKYLHDKQVIHRDIKCSNILVDASGSVKLADFGLAKVTTLNDIMSFKGTPFWMAPEVVNLKNGSYGIAADIWSLGCTVLEMLTRQHPYPHLDDVQALFKIFNGEPPLVPDSLSRDAQDFILKCLQVNPNDRPTATQLLDHPFLTRHNSI